MGLSELLARLKVVTFLPAAVTGFGRLIISWLFLKFFSSCLSKLLICFFADMMRTVCYFGVCLSNKQELPHELKPMTTDVNSIIQISGLRRKPKVSPLVFLSKAVIVTGAKIQPTTICWIEISSDKNQVKSP